MVDYKQHWNQVYSKAKINKLGWYEAIPQLSLDLINKCKIDKNSAILDVGSGVTTLIDCLVKASYRNLTASDISKVALENARKRIDANEVKGIRWIVEDITDPICISKIGEVDLWHDRTVLHFLTEKQQQQGYLNTLTRVVKRGGYVIIAVFSLEGAKKCSGLDVKNYDHQMISDFLGSDFELLDHIPHIYTMPSGDCRPYIYTRFLKHK